MENKQKKKKKKQKFSVQYYTLNLKILPAPSDKGERYASLLDSWFAKNFRIKIDSDNSHYFSLTRFDKFVNGKGYYGVVSKYLSMDSIDFVDENGDLVEIEIPHNVQARSNEYEFVFIPECHRFAFVKAGKINPKIIKRGAPLKQMNQIIWKAMNNLVGEGEQVEVIPEQSEEIFEEIYNQDVLSLDVRVTYTNDDLNDEHAEFFDELLKGAHVGEFNAKMKPDSTGKIDTSTEPIQGLIELAKENGFVQAHIKDETGSKSKIDTRKHPSVNDVSVEDPRDRVGAFVMTIFDKFINKFR